MLSPFTAALRQGGFRGRTTEGCSQGAVSLIQCLTLYLGSRFKAEPWKSSQPAAGSRTDTHGAGHHCYPHDMTDIHITLVPTGATIPDCASSERVTPKNKTVWASFPQSSGVNNSTGPFPIASAPCHPRELNLGFLMQAAVPVSQH